MTLYSFFYKQPILRSDVLLDEKLVKKMNDSRHHKENIGFWNYFPNYNFELFDGMIYFSLNRERSKNLIGYLNLLFSDFIIYEDKQHRIKLKLSVHHNILSLHFAFLFFSTTLYGIFNSLFQFHFFDINALLFFVLGAYCIIEFFFHNINSIRLSKINHFINSENYEMDNPNEDG
jgi:hypothetical protein